MQPRIRIAYSTSSGIAEAAMVLPLAAGGHVELIARTHVADLVRAMRARGVDFQSLGGMHPSRDVVQALRGAARQHALLAVCTECARYLKTGSLERHQVGGAGKWPLPKIDKAADLAEAKAIAWWYDQMPGTATPAALDAHWFGLNNDARENRYVVLALLRAAGVQTLSPAILADMRKQLRAGDDSAKAKRMRKLLRDVVFRRPVFKGGNALESIAKTAVRVVKAAAPVITAVNPALGIGAQTVVNTAEQALQENAPVARAAASAAQLAAQAAQGNPQAQAVVAHTQQTARTTPYGAPIQVPIDVRSPDGQNVYRLLVTVAQAS